MGKTNIRLGNTLTFDSEKESDIIELVNKAREQHKLGEFISHLIRIYNEEPEKLGSSKTDIEREILKMENIGLTPKRYEYMNDVSKELREMKCRVDDIYEKCLEIHSMAKFGKHIGLENKTDNSLIASFILEKQINDMCSILGIDNVDHTFYSNKIDDAKKRSDDTLEYIINTYDGIVSEIKNMAIRETNIQVASTLTDINNSKELVSDNGRDKQNTAEVEDVQIEEEYIDFGDADITALSNFFGE